MTLTRVSMPEQAGTLEEMLERVAEAYDTEVEITAQKVTSMIEPLMIVALSLVVGFIVVAILLPENLKLRFFVPEPVLPALRVGQAVAARCDGCGEEIPATVSFISTQPEFTPPVIYSRERREKLVFLVEARVAPEQARRLHPGQPVDVRLK